ncbi:rho family small GTP binding protein cdc42 [Mycena sanguinolenta]|nr:rho family small GTP binding protein cdc42 [Mycena sanguinolenta]
MGLLRPVIKCILVGDSDVGKTCLLTAYLENRFPTGYIPRNYDGNARPDMWHGGVPYTLQVFDTAGGPEYEHQRPLGYPWSDVFLICFSVGLPASLERVKTKWLADAQYHCPGVACVIAATQIDLRGPDIDTDANSGETREGRRELITTAQGEELAREIKAVKYVECSAKTREGVQDVFDAVVAAAVQNLHAPQKHRRRCVVL